MTEAYFKDDGGESMKVKVIDGFSLPCVPVPCAEEEFLSIPNWEVREDDVMLCAYPKSGTHWLWEMASMIIAGDETFKTGKESTMLDFVSQLKCASLPSPRLLSSHLYPKHLPIDFFKREKKILFVVRNPKDIAVSKYNHTFNMEKFYSYNGEFKNFLKLFIQGKTVYGEIFEYMDIWQKFIEEHPKYPIHVVYYEDLITNGVEELEKINKFLGHNRNRKFLQTVYERCGFASMKAAKENNYVFKTFCRDQKPNIYRKGEIGDWKNWFTVVESENFDSIMIERTSKSMFKYKFS